MTPRLDYFNGQLQYFAQRALGDSGDMNRAAADALRLAESVEKRREPPDVMAEKLRASAMCFRRVSPVLTAHMKIIADELETRGNA